MILLPNGSNWDNDKLLAEQEPLAQFWYMETLKLALQGDVSVLRCGIDWVNKIKYQYPFYNRLERDGFILTGEGWYRYTGGESEEDYYNVNNWVSSPDTKF